MQALGTLLSSVLCTEWVSTQAPLSVHVLSCSYCYVEESFHEHYAWQVLLLYMPMTHATSTMSCSHLLCTLSRA